MDNERDDGCRRYRDVRFSEERAQFVGLIRAMVEEYGQQGMNITVRQIFYQLLARGHRRPDGSVIKYAIVQSALNDGRMAGLIPWHYVVDRGRSLRGLRTWSSPLAAVREMRAAYRTDVWATQPWRPEFWVEKQALEGVVGDIANTLRVDYYATKGYDSQSQQWLAGQRLADYVRRGQRPIIFYMGDHDPSGLHMTEDVAERLRLFVGTPVTVVRLALTRSQIDQYDPPPFDVKDSDSRSPGYRAEHGDEAWELDALNPSVLKQLMTDAVGQIRDQSAWDEAMVREVGDERELDEMIAAMGGTDDEESDA